jgi:hypothetical protein
MSTDVHRCARFKAGCSYFETVLPLILSSYVLPRGSALQDWVSFLSVVRILSHTLVQRSHMQWVSEAILPSWPLVPHGKLTNSASETGIFFPLVLWALLLVGSNQVFVAYLAAVGISRAYKLQSPREPVERSYLSSKNLWWPLGWQFGSVQRMWLMPHCPLHTALAALSQE